MALKRPAGRGWINEEQSGSSSRITPRRGKGLLSRGSFPSVQFLSGHKPRSMGIPNSAFRLQNVSPPPTPAFSFHERLPRQIQNGSQTSRCHSCRGNFPALVSSSPACYNAITNMLANTYRKIRCAKYTGIKKKKKLRQQLQGPPWRGWEEGESPGKNPREGRTLGAPPESTCTCAQLRIKCIYRMRSYSSISGERKRTEPYLGTEIEKCSHGLLVFEKGWRDLDTISGMPPRVTGAIQPASTERCTLPSSLCLFWKQLWETSL